MKRRVVQSNNRLWEKENCTGEKEERSLIRDGTSSQHEL